MKICNNGLNNADNVMKGGVLLACHHGLTEEMLSHMHQVCEEFLKNINEHLNYRSEWVSCKKSY